MGRKFLLVLIAAVLAPAAFYLWRELNKDQRQAAPAPAMVPEPSVRYPVEDLGPMADSLPPLSESDDTVHRAVAALFGGGFERLVISKDIVRRVVATIDNLSRDQVSAQLMPVKPAGGLTLTMETDAGVAIARENAARYLPYVRIALAVPTDKLAALYVRFYPLLQQQYEALGYPDGYFNDRVVQVIDHLLATPDVREPLVLVQPRVLYEFADPTLQNLSAGQKILLRMGAENRQQAKAKLREFRQAITAENAAGDLRGP
ncbi:MAG TPA: DUF3014 domain-containing protein [Candidatus Binatia bacterium]